MHPGLLLWIGASSILLILSFPRPDAGLCSFVALVPLLAGLTRVSGLKAFFAGWATGTAWFFVSYNWVSYSVTNFGGIPYLTAEGVILLLAGIHGLYIAVFAILVSMTAGEGIAGEGSWNYGGVGGEKPAFLTPLLRHPLTPLLILPSAWVILEFSRSWFPSPFPWLLLGSATWKFPIFGTIYEMAGVYGVSFWIVMVNTLVWTALKSRGPQLGRIGLLLLVVITLPLILYPVQKKGTGPKLTVGVVQGNFQQEIKWDESLREETLATYLNLTDRAVQEGARLVVWPETAIPVYYQAEPEIKSTLRRFTSDQDIDLIFGSPGYKISGSDILLYNRIYHLSPDGREEFYNKNQLVPFGEYVPLSRVIPFVDKMVPGEGEFARGTWDGPFNTPVPSGALICYEVSFPSLARREVEGGSSLLVNVTNDAWFGRSWGPYQHLAITAVRAMENRVPVFRAANTGISAIIDTSGRIVRSIPLLERGVIVADVATGMGRTVYTRFGDWIVILSAAVLSVYLLLLLNLWRLRKWTR